RLLDAGAMGIVFPHVDTPEHAKQLVSNCKYPPMGHRSLGGPVAQLGFRPYPPAEATALVNTETLLVMMLETPKAIDNAEALAAVPGVDVLLIGTNDLTLEIGIPGQYDDPRAVHAYETVIATCKRHGKYPGMGVIYDHPTMEKYIKMGARFLLSDSDLSFLTPAGAGAAGSFGAALPACAGGSRAPSFCTARRGRDTRRRRRLRCSAPTRPSAKRRCRTERGRTYTLPAASSSPTPRRRPRAPS